MENTEGQLCTNKTLYKYEKLVRCGPWVFAYHRKDVSLYFLFGSHRDKCREVTDLGVKEDSKEKSREAL